MLSRNVFVPLDRSDASNPCLHVESPRPGIFIYRFPDGFNYINQTQHIYRLLTYITKQTRRTETLQYDHPSDRPWNEPIFSESRISPDESNIEACKPTLKAVVLDFSTVDITDTGAIEGLVELRAQLQRWAKPGPIEWHFANVEARWVRRALAAGGFGYPCIDELDGRKYWNPVFTLAERNGQRQNKNSQSSESSMPARVRSNGGDVERGDTDTEIIPPEAERLVATHGVNYPNIHVDLAAAVEAAAGFNT
ncbi:hypothetical protein F4781DRAFT_417727 [Annulohypoxylon bovei var. microspora]|nr:hypothetical protein F4781DRAFT_417727 [Annulohypoxylon bovei var. microspora]